MEINNNNNNNDNDNDNCNDNDNDNDNARDHDLREHIPHTWASSHDNLFQSNLSTWSSCEAILGKTPDWPI